MKYKVVCNKTNCWTRTYENEQDAKTAAENHKKRLGHNPVYIYVLEEDVNPVARELLAYTTPKPEDGINQIKII